jgi:hypothetical protein
MGSGLRARLPPGWPGLSTHRWLIDDLYYGAATAGLHLNPKSVGQHTYLQDGG